MHTHETNQVPPRPATGLPGRRRRRIVIAVGALLLLAAAMGCAIYLLLQPGPVPSPDAPPEKIIAFIASDRYATLPESQQIPYIQRITRLTMPQLFLAAGASG